MYAPIEQTMLLLIWIIGLCSVFVLALTYEEIYNFRRWWRENTPASWRDHK